MTTILGIDIGGTGIKGAPVDLDKGTLAADRFRIPTPPGGSPGDVARVVGEIVAHFDTTGPVGCTFPAVMRHGVALTAANVDKAWIGTDAQALFEGEVRRPFVVVNDADAAGIAEVAARRGARTRQGPSSWSHSVPASGARCSPRACSCPTPSSVTSRSGGKPPEQRASEKAREEHDLTWDKWAKRVNEVLLHIEALICPDLFIIGGGVSKKSEKFLPLLEIRAKVVPAQLLNEAGIVGAAIAASRSTS